jgi:hypothetical protein
MFRALRPIWAINVSELRFYVASNHWLCLDGGGKWREHKYVAFCGYLADVEQFEQFSADWKRELQAANLTALHASEAMAWEGDDWAKFYREWGEDRDLKRQALFERFIDVIRRHPSLTAIGMTADSNGLRVKSANSSRPDLMLFERVVKIAMGRIESTQNLSIFCDWEDGFDEMCLRLLRKLRIQGVVDARRVVLLAFGDDQAYPELQAADLFAYLSCRETQRHGERSQDPVDPLYERLMSGVAVAPPSRVLLTEMFDADEFRRMVESQPAKPSAPTARGAGHP